MRKNMAETINRRDVREEVPVLIMATTKADTVEGTVEEVVEEEIGHPEEDKTTNRKSSNSSPMTKRTSSLRSQS